MFKFVAMLRAIKLEKRTAIIGLSKRGYLIFDIANRLNISVATVKRWNSRYVQELSMNTRYANCRGMPALDENERTRLSTTCEKLYKYGVLSAADLDLLI